MDYAFEYRTSLELASTLRYREARERLQGILREKPNDINALILLGKVEYYLRLYDSARSRFETALTYDSDNIAAYLGLEYFKERKKKIYSWITLSAIIITFSLSLLFLGVFVNRELVHFKADIYRRIDSFALSTGVKLNSFSDQLKQTTDSTNTGQDKIMEGMASLSRQIAELKSQQQKLLTHNYNLIMILKKEIVELKQNVKTLSKQFGQAEQ